MDDTRLQWTPDGLERFSQLEDKIFQAVEEIKAIRIENSRLNEQLNEQIQGNEALRGEIDGLKRDAGEYERLLGENDGLRQQIETMRQSETDMLETLAQFEKEREEILERAKKEREEMRDRVEKSLTLLASLEAQ